MSISSEQQSWAADSWEDVVEAYEQWTTEGSSDYSPLLKLIEFVRSNHYDRTLSAGTSMRALVIARADSVLAWHKLGENAPRISVTQMESRFVFGYAPNGRSGQSYGRECEFGEGSAYWRASY